MIISIGMDLLFEQNLSLCSTEIMFRGLVEKKEKRMTYVRTDLLLRSFLRQKKKSISYCRKNPNRGPSRVDKTWFCRRVSIVDPMKPISVSDAFVFKPCKIACKRLRNAHLIITLFQNFQNRHNPLIFELPRRYYVFDPLIFESH